MTMVREVRGGGDPSLRRKAWAVASLLALVALVVGSLFGDRGMLQLFAHRKRAEALQGEIQDLRAENLRLGAEIQSLRSDPRAIERLAREELGLARRGETVFILREDQVPARP
jgi:cell division protein FtsB